MATKLGKWLDQRAEKKRLKQSFEQNRLECSSALKDAVALVGQLPEGERRTAIALMQEFRQRQTDARLAKDWTQRDDAMSSLLVELKQWVVSKSAMPTVPSVTPTVPVSGTDALADELDRVKRIQEAATKRQLPVPPLVGTAVATGQKVVDLKDKAVATQVDDARKLLQVVIGVEGALLDFVDAWPAAAQTETQATTRLPQDIRLFDAIHARWLTDRDDVKSRWEKLVDVQLAQIPGQLQSAVTHRAASERERLLKLYEAAVQQRDDLTRRRDDLAVSRLCDLGPADQALAMGRNGLASASDGDQLKAAQQNLDNAGLALDKAQQSLVGAKGEALAQFNKLRKQLVDQLAKAQLVRGASIDGSPVKAAIAEARVKLDKADELLKSALASGHVLASCKELEDGLKLKIDAKAAQLGKVAKKQANADLNALPAYQLAFDQLKTTRARVAEIVGGHLQLQQLDALMLQVQVDRTGRAPGGFEAALKLMKNNDPAKLEVAAQEAAKSSKGSDERVSAQQALDEFAQCHTAFEVAVQRQALAKAFGGDDPKAALSTLKQELGRIEKARRAEVDKWNKEVERLGVALQDLVDKQGMSAQSSDLAAMRSQLDRAKSMLDGWQIDAVERGLGVLAELVKQTGESLAQAKSAWEQQADPLQKLYDLAQDALDAPQLKMLANTIVQGVDKTREAVSSGSIDLAEAVVRARRLLDLQQGLETAKQQSGLDLNAQVLKAYGVAAGRFEKEWQKRVAEAQKALDVVDEALRKQGVKNGAASTPWPAALTPLRDGFSNAARKLELKSGNDPQVRLEEVFDEHRQALDDWQASLPNVADPKDGTLQKALDDGKRTEQVASWRKTFETAQRFLSELESSMTVVLQDERNKLGSFDENTVDAVRAKAWTDLATALAKRVQTQRAEQRKLKAPALQEARSLESVVAKKFLDRQSVTFAPLYDNLRKRIADAQELLKTEDPDLIAAANRQLAEIRLITTDAKGKGGKGSVSLSMVQERHSKLSHLLGDGAIVQSRLPDTYKRLKQQLDAAMALAMRSPPDEGMQAMELLRQPMLEARAAAKAMQVRYDGFKLRRGQVEERLDKVKDHTGTTLFGGRMKAYNERFKVRLDEAHALARQEGQIDAALKALDEMDRELTELLALKPDAAREQLQSMNADAENDQRELRDLARTWNTTQDHWTGTVLPRIDKLVKARGEDDTAFKSLEAAVLNLGKTLDPYLAVVSMVPHKRGLSNGAPDMKVARDAFAQAHRRLGQLNRSAQRLAGDEGSTSVELQRDLTALEQEWSRRVIGAVDALSRLGTGLKALPDRVKTTEGDTDFLSPQDKDKLVQSVDTLVPLVQKLSTRFPGDAFATQLNVLKSGSTPPQRKKAREEALRTVRQMRTDIVDNPLFMQLFDGASKGLLDVDVRAPLGLLRAGLKKIELAVLVGI